MDGASLPAWLLCLAWASSGPAAWDGIDATAPPRPAEAVLPLPHSLRLEWTHSIERVRWQEWYTPSLPPDPLGWRLLRVRVHGSGAGMEPAPDAVWRAGGDKRTPHGSGHRGPAPDGVGVYCQLPPLPQRALPAPAIVVAIRPRYHPCHRPGAWPCGHSAGPHCRPRWHATLTWRGGRPRTE